MTSVDPMYGNKVFEIAGLDGKKRDSMIPNYSTDYAFANDPMNYQLREMTPMDPTWKPQAIPLMEADEKKE
jgi:hypothetical protein